MHRFDSSRPARPAHCAHLNSLVWPLFLLAALLVLGPKAHAGSILREFFGGIGGTAISDLTNNPAYPNSPTFTNYVTDFFEAPTDVDENYGQRMHGYIVPPISGNYTFWIASDDNSVLFLSTDENPANSRVICYVPQWTSSRNWFLFPEQQSAAIALQAGKAYYISALQKEGGGGDNLAVRWVRPDGLDGDNPIPGAYLLPWGTSFTIPQISQQPTNTTVVEGQTAAFTIGVKNLDQIFYQWSKNGAKISGATNATLNYGPVTLDDEGLSFGATLTNKLGSTNSASALLHVTLDVTAPTLTQVINQSSTSLLVIFSEAVDSASATTLSNYQLDGGLTVTAAAPGSDAQSIVLTTSAIAFGSNYTLTVNGVKDRARTPNVIAPNSSLTFLALEFVSQSIGGATGGAISRVGAGSFNLSGAGSDIGGTSDQFQFAWASRSGDFDVQVRLADAAITDAYLHAGLMARSTLDTNSPFAAAFAASARIGSFFESRASAGATASIPTPVGSFPANYPQAWLRLKRAGNVFTGYGSLDGKTWTQLGSATISMPTKIYLGLAVASENAARASVAQFRDYSSTVSVLTGSYTPEHEPLTPSTRTTGLIFSEVMYHPKADPRFVNDLEYVEIFNADDVFEDLTGYTLAGGINYRFPDNFILPAGAFVVVALDPAAVRTAYGITNVLGPYSGKLDNAGDTIQMRDGFGALKLDMTYSDAAPWPVAADGAGHSLVLTRPSYGENDPRAWSISSQMGGSPGRDDLIVPNPQKDITINEFLANSDGTQEPFIELYNHSGSSVNVGGCYLTDSPTTNRYRIPDGTTVAARKYVSFTASQLGFSPNGAGGTIFLVNSNATRVLDAIGFGGQEMGVSTGRSPDGSATVRRLAQSTPGAVNASWRVEDIIINEIMFAPISGDKNDQYIELYNRTTNAISLNNWRLSDAVDYKFPSTAVLPAGGYVVVARSKSQILSNYANLNATNTFGNWSGSLNKSGHIALSKAGPYVTTNAFQQAATNSVRIIASDVAYLGGGRWTKYAKEGGSSLELIDPRGDLLQPGSWADSDETRKAPWTTNTVTGTLDLGMDGYNPDRLYVYMQDGGEALVDEIEVIKAGGTVNALSNGNFETTAAWGFFGDHARSAIEANVGFGGSRALHLRADDKGLNGLNSVQSPMTGLASGNSVTIRAKTRWLAGAKELLVRMRGGWLELPVQLAVPKNLGTPGLPNSRLVANAGPAIYDVRHAPLLPVGGASVLVTCKVSDPDGIGPVKLNYRVDPAGNYTQVTMRDDGTGGDAISGDGIYSATIPGQGAGALVGFTITANDGAATAASASFPGSTFWTVGLPRYECYVRWGDVQPSGTFAYYYLWDSQASEAQRGSALNNTYRDTTLVYGNWRVIYNAGFRDKGSPFHGGAGSFSVTNPDDEPLLGETDRIFRSTGNGGADGVPIRNRLACWIGRKMNIPYLNSHYMQLFRNGGQMENVSQDEEYPGMGYSKQWFPDGSNGDVYKIAVWFEYADDNSSFGSVSATLESFKTAGKFKLARYRDNWITRGFQGTYNNYTNIFNLVAAANDTTTNFVQNLTAIADVEEFMRVFAYDRVLGNWDSWTYSVGQNMFAIKQAGLPWQIMPWDIDFTLGAGDGPSGPLWGGQDPVVNNWFNNPAIRRMLWRGFQKAAYGQAMDPAQYQAVGDQLQSAMVRNIGNVSGPSTLYTFISQRRAYIISQLQANDVGSFSITRNNGNNYVSTTASTVLTGKAPFSVVSVAVNGVAYPTVWTDQNSWSINVPLTGVTNVLNVTGVDAAGTLVAGNSASITVTFSGAVPLVQDNVVINEIHYNPAEPKASFIEFYNNSTTTPFDLSGHRVDGVNFTFPNGSIIQPGKFMVVAGDRAGFALAYGQTIPIVGEFPGALDNSGEALRLVKPLGMGGTNDLIVSEVQFSSRLPWPTNANGLGPSLQLIDPTRGSVRVANWAATAPTDANRVTPGRANSVKTSLAAFVPVWINEALPNSVTGPLDNVGQREPFIELYNNSSASVSLYGLYLSDNYTNLTAWAFPPEATIGPKQFLVIWADGQPEQSAAGVYHTSFRLNPTNGSIALSRFQANGTVPVDYLDYAQIAPDRSFGSYPDAEPLNRRLFSTVTPGAANDPTAQAANIVINEFMAANTATIVDDATGNFEDWFELYNAGTNDVDLTSFRLTSSLTNSTEFRIPPGYLLPAGKFLLVWADDMSRSNQVADPALHVNFKLTKAGGDIGLFNPDGRLVDGFTYAEQTNDVSQGHFPDGDLGPLVSFDAASPGVANVLSGANQAPVLAGINDRTIPEQVLFTFTASATDPDAGQTIEYSLGIGSPAGAAIDPVTGVFSWTPSEEQGPGVYPVAIIASDSGVPVRRALQRFVVTVTEANRAPIIDPIADITADDSTLLAFTATATDPDVPANHVSFSLGNGAPAGAAIDPATGRFTWTPAPAQADVYQIVVRATDDGSPAQSADLAVNVTVRVVDHPPVITQLSQQFIDEGSTLSVTLHATDPNSPPAQITYSLEGIGLPSGLNIDPNTGVLTFTPTEEQGPNTYGVIVRATKNSGAHLSSAITFGITVNEVDQAPKLNSIADVEAEEGSLVSFKVTATDADLPPQNLRYALGDDAPAGATIDLVSGQFTWQIPADGASLTNKATVFVIDDSADALNDSKTITIKVKPKFRAVINEIMYHPNVANAAYVELINPSTVRTQDLTGVVLGGPRMNYAFAAGTQLAPGKIMVVAQNRAAFQSAFGNSLQVAGEWTGSFDRSDAWVRLYALDGENHTNILNQVNFKPGLPWSTNADDGNVSLQLIDATRDNSRVGNWTAVPATAQPQWQHVVSTGTASSSTLYLYLETVGDVYLDDISIVAGSVPEVGQNFVADGDFETALTGPWGISTNLTPSSLSTAIKHSGNSSLHMVTTTGGTTRASAIYQDLATALTASASYTLSYWYLPNTNGGTLTLRLSGSGIKSTLDITPTNTVVTRLTPTLPNNVVTALDDFPKVWINEVLPNNVGGITDAAGEHEPWIELMNSGSTALDLSGWHLTSDYTQLGAWTFPNGTTIPAGGFLLVFADGQSAQTTANELHTSFRLPAANGSVALVRSQATGLAVVDYVDYGAIAADISMASVPDGQSFFRATSASPTPRGVNTPSPNLPPVFATVVGNQSVTLGQTLTLPLSASDPDQPGQSLIYTLDIAPQGATIGASSGILTWTPASGQVGVNPVRVRVSDNGSPSLSAIMDFNVTVQTVLVGPITVTAAIAAPSGLRLSWNATVGVTYRVEYKQTLADAEWTALSQAIATQTTETAIDSNPGQTRFYRVVAP